MDDTGLGTLTRQGDRWTLTFTRTLAHSREKVWRAVTEPEHLAVWYPQEIVGERRAGAPLSEISQLLRHQHEATTSKYGTIDPDELGPVTAPWPGEAS